MIYLQLFRSKDVNTKESKIKYKTQNNNIDMILKIKYDSQKYPRKQSSSIFIFRTCKRTSNIEILFRVSEVMKMTDIIEN